MNTQTGVKDLIGMNVGADSWIAGKTLEDLARGGFPRNSLIAMILRGQQVIIPHGAETLKPGDRTCCIVSSDHLRPRVNRVFRAWFRQSFPQSPRA